MVSLPFAPNFEGVIILISVVVDGRGKKTKGSVIKKSRSFCPIIVTTSEKTVPVLERPEGNQPSFLIGACLWSTLCLAVVAAEERAWLYASRSPLLFLQMRCCRLPFECFFPGGTGLILLSWFSRAAEALCRDQALI